MPLPGSLQYKLPLMELLCSADSANFDFSVKVLIEVSAFLDFEKVLMLRGFYS